MEFVGICSVTAFMYAQPTILLLTSLPLMRFAESIFLVQQLGLKPKHFVNIEFVHGQSQVVYLDDLLYIKTIFLLYLRACLTNQ